MKLMLHVSPNGVAHTKGEPHLCGHDQWREVTVEIPDEPKKQREMLLHSMNGEDWHKEDGCNKNQGERIRVLELPAEPPKSRTWTLYSDLLAPVREAWEVLGTGDIIHESNGVLVTDRCWRCGAKAGEGK